LVIGSNISSKQQINEMNNNVLNFLLFNGYKDTFEDLYQNTDSRIDLSLLLNKANPKSRKDSENLQKMYRSNSFQNDIALRRIRSNSGTQLSSSAIFKRRKSSFRHLNMQKQDENVKINKMLTFKKGSHLTFLI
jgi:hypothetical protein